MRSIAGLALLLALCGGCGGANLCNPPGCRLGPANHIWWRPCSGNCPYGYKKCCGQLNCGCKGYNCSSQTCKLGVPSAGGAYVPNDGPGDLHAKRPKHSAEEVSPPKPQFAMVSRYHPVPTRPVFGSAPRASILERESQIIRPGDEPKPELPVQRPMSPEAQQREEEREEYFERRLDNLPLPDAYGP